MLKILIAEDELPLLRGLKHMVEQCSEEYQVVQCVHNGKEAIEYLKENEVDVVLTDINMPLADGTEVMKYIYENISGTDCVVVSGYSDFEYAQKALRYGGADYLLKPVMKNDLVLCMEKIEQKRNLDGRKKKQEALKDIVYTGKKTEGEEYLQIVYLCAGPFIKEGLEESVIECNFWRGTDIEQEIKELLTEKTTIYAFEKYQENERILLISSKQEVNVKKMLQEFIQQMERRSICVNGVYKQDKISTMEIPKLSRKMRKALYQKILFGKSGCYEYEDLPQNHTMREEARYFHEYGEYPDKAGAMVLELERYLQKTDITQREVYGIVKEFFECLQPSGQYEDVLWSLILYSENAKTLLENTKTLLEENNLHNKEESAEDLMKRVERYMAVHMAEPITAATISGEFGLVAPYLSKLYKDYSGYTLSQYIQKLRIEEAMRLLDGSDILAKDIANMVGYSDPLYFSKIFKKKVGLYPSEYKKRKNRT